MPWWATDTAKGFMKYAKAARKVVAIEDVTCSMPKTMNEEQ